MNKVSTYNTSRGILMLASETNKMISILMVTKFLIHVHCILLLWMLSIHTIIILCIQTTLCDQLDDCVRCFLDAPCPSAPCLVPTDCSIYCINKTFEQLEVDQDIPGRCIGMI